MSNPILYFDGGCRPVNPGPAGFGVYIIYDIRHKPVIYSDAIGVATNNQAEFCGLIAAISVAKQLGFKQVDIKSDSLIVINQVRGKFAVHAPALKKLCIQARRMLYNSFGDKWTLEWIKRDENSKADMYCTLAIKGHIRCPKGIDRAGVRAHYNKLLLPQ